mgnify:CR=1 FL=1
MQPEEPAPTPWEFPTPEDDDDELIAVGADLEPATLLTAYRRGLFPMPIRLGRRDEIGWFSPDPRGVLPLDGLKVSRSLRKSCARFDIRMDTEFERVMRACGDPRREHGWINDEFVEAYTRLNRMGWAHSVEAWLDGELVGGLYGVHIDRFFAGESMFHTVTDASKVALVALVDWLHATGAVLLDVQWCTPHLASLGVVEVPRREYLGLLAEAVRPTGSSTSD